MDKIEKYEKTLVEQNVLNEKLIKNREKNKAHWKKQNEVRKLRRKLDPEYRQYFALINKQYRAKNKEKVKEYSQRPDIKTKRQEYHRKRYQANKEKQKTLYNLSIDNDIQINLTKIKQETETVLFASTVNAENKVMARPEIPKTPEIIDIILDMSEKKYGVDDNQLLTIEFKCNVSKL